MNERQRAYYEKLRQFQPAEPKDSPSPVVYTGGEYQWKWKCAGCGSLCIGEPIERHSGGRQWFCYCARN